jgi:multicomponent Na+:H+ antiporter subunit D
MFTQDAILVLLWPFLAAFVVSMTGLYRKRWCYPLTILALAWSLWEAIILVGLVHNSPDNEIHYYLGDWPPPIGIEFVIDPLNAGIIVAIALVALLTAIFSFRAVPKETPGKEAQFYTLYLLLVTGIMGMTITGDAFNLYVFLEISSLASYALIAMGPGRAALSCFNYIIMGTIGASFYLLGVGYLYIKTGSLNMADIHQIMETNNLYETKTIHIGFILILIGVWIKMAFFPLHRWLPDAYSYAPTTSSAVIAPLMTKVSIYVMIRYMYTVFSPSFVYLHQERGTMVVWIAVVAILVGTFYALARLKLRKIFSYLIVVEVGYMVGGVWLHNHTALKGAVFHILADALMTLALFLFAGIINYMNKTGNIRSLGGLYYKMPLTMAGFTVAAFSMIGIPPTAGFFSKWYLISGGIEAGHWGYVVALLLSSLVNAVLFFRIIERAFFEAPKIMPGEAVGSRDKVPATMLAPLLATSLLIVLLGVFSNPVFQFISRYVTGTE